MPKVCRKYKGFVFEAPFKSFHKLECFRCYPFVELDVFKRHPENQALGDIITMLLG